MPATFAPREAQQKILEYAGGPMGISAVPGSGKTFTLSRLAADLVDNLAHTASLDEREILIVTFTNNAVENFQNRIAGFVSEERGLLPGVGYRVRTLHGLAHDIVRERPSLAGLSEDFAIVDERTSNDIIEEAVGSYLNGNPNALAAYMQPEYLRSGRNIDRYLQRDTLEIAQSVIRTVKDGRIDLHELNENLRRQSGTWPLLDLGLQVFADYQQSLRYRGAVDFDDLIALSLRVLESDDGYLDRLQERWPYVLEDEAQDSSALQEKLLRMLTAAHGNWVRVGDPNQAINTTFTSARARFLRDFIKAHEEQSRKLPVSGRSALPIIETANRLINWSCDAHPVLSGDEVLSLPLIKSTPPGDPQPNPPAEESEVHLFDRALSPDGEIDVLVTSLRRWLPENEDRTVAVLAPTQARISHIAAALEDAGLAVDDSLMRAGSATRAATKALASLLKYLAQPEAGALLATAWTEAWWPQKGERLVANGNGEDSVIAPTSASRRRSSDLPEPVRTFAAALQRLRQPEDFLFPARSDWLDMLAWIDEVVGFRDLADHFRADMQRWTQATVLPVDELMLTVGNELFEEPAHLALTHHLAVLLAKLTRENQTWRLPELARELQYIAENRRRMPDFSADAGGYEPKPGVVTLATMHGAKGLEWDRVYLTAVNSYNFPGGSDDERYRGESFYARDRLNLVAETLEQLSQVQMGTLDEYVEGKATQRARRDTAAERLRLFYVGITRARRELIVTYNTGRRPDSDPLPPAVAFQALIDSAAQAP